jgi:hypothetical protein
MSKYVGEQAIKLSENKADSSKRQILENFALYNLLMSKVPIDKIDKIDKSYL